MKTSSLLRAALVMVALVAGLWVARNTTRNTAQSLENPTGAKAQNELNVGFLPVTCHLTCPVTDFATRTSTTNRFVSKRFTNFPDVVDNVKSGSRLLRCF